jgi:hypothetical protein
VCKNRLLMSRVLSERLSVSQRPNGTDTFKPFDFEDLALAAALVSDCGFLSCLRNLNLEVTYKRMHLQGASKCL